MAADDEALKLRILRLMGEVAVRRSRARVESQTIKDNLAFEVQSSERAVVYVPHYWAIYYHDGRGVVPRRALPPGRYLVWYKDPALDPRLAGGPPERAVDVRKLTKAEFQRDLLAGRLVVARRAGPTAGNPFFTKALSGFDAIIARRVTAEFARYVRTLLPRQRKRKITISF